jgi:arylsulfatase A-like enzyme
VRRLRVLVGIPLAIAWLACSGGERPRLAQGDPRHPNVLLIAVDDLVGAAGDGGRPPRVAMPNVDRLAARGMRFDRAYAAAPQCNPSRVAVLSGLQPARTGIYENEYDAREMLDPDHVMLQQKFSRNGYFAAGCGKIYHYQRTDTREWDELCDVRGQDPHPADDDPEYVRRPLMFGPTDATDAELRDMKAATWASEQLQREHERPFFLAVGFERPHLPWKVPRKYFERHPLDSIVMPPVRENDLDDVPPIGRLFANPGVGFEAPPEGDVAALRRLGLEKRARRAYLASVDVADAALGRVLDALEASRYADHTVVVLWSDNGFHFGEKQHWRKGTLWEESTNVLLVVSAPGITPPGSRFAGVVGLIDLYPTLVELAGLPEQPGLDGASFAAALRDPALPWDRVALSTYGPGNHAVRSRRFRYVRYQDGGEELYDHDADPYEWTNLAGDPTHEGTRRELAHALPREDAPDRLRHSVFQRLRVTGDAGR